MFVENARYNLIQNQAQTYGCFGKVLPDMPETLGELIQRRMKDLQIPSKAELARRLGISPAYAGDLANDTGKTKDGSYKPSPELVSKLSRELKVSEIEILNSIGYVSGENASDSIELLEGVRVTFQGKKFTKAEQEELLNAMRLVAAGARARKEAEKEKDRE
jgi:transcriptional regulator with XRE-family HTH domain